MSVSMVTAGVAVDRWQLRGQPVYRACGCRLWNPPGTLGARLVYTCEGHRQ